MPDAVKTSRAGDGLSLLSSLISNINSKQTPKRSFFSNLHFELAPGLTISIKGYQILHRQKPQRTYPIWMGGEKPMLAHPEAVRVDSEARTVDKSEIMKAWKFGGEFICFKPEEAAALREFGSKVLRLIGFKPRSMLPSWASVKKSVFIYPSEELFVGSTRVFSALWQKLLKDDKIGIAWFIPRVNSQPQIVAIIPSENPDEEGAATPYLPAGLWLYPLPFADDVRKVDASAPPKKADELATKMREIVGNLQLPKGIYNPLKYPNPALQWHYRVLQAMALEDEVPDENDKEDLTIPKYRQIAKRVGGYMAEWKELLEEKTKAFIKSRALKREAEDEDGGRPVAKRARTVPTIKEGSVSGSKTGNAKLKEMFENGTLKNMTVADLKDVLTSKGVSATGKKGQLLEKLEQWIEQNLY